MKNYKYLLLVSTCLLFNNETLASELNLTFNSSSLPLGMNATLSTHTPNVELKPISDFIKLAFVCAVTEDGCRDVVFGSVDTDTGKQCSDNGFVNSCPTGYVPDYSKKCPDDSSYFKCKPCSNSCSSGSLAYCNSNQIETGNSRNECNETCYTCRAKTCEEGGFESSIPTNQTCTSTTYYGQTCYKDCYKPSCSEGGFLATCPASSSCTTTTYYGKTCYINGGQPTCSSGGFVSSIPTNQTCTSTTYYGQTCYKNCYKPSCSDGGFLATCPASSSCTSTTYYGQTCYTDGGQPTCSSGGFLASCPANHSCTSATYYGRTCYTDGGQPTCSAGGYLDSCPANHSCTSATYYGRTCYTDGGQPTCAAGGFEASIPSGKTCTATSYYGRTCYKNCVTDEPEPSPEPSPTPEPSPSPSSSSSPSTPGGGGGSTTWEKSQCDSHYGQPVLQCTLSMDRKCGYDYAWTGECDECECSCPDYSAHPECEQYDSGRKCLALRSQASHCL